MKGPEYYRKIADRMAMFFILLCLGAVVGILYYTYMKGM